MAPLDGLIALVTRHVFLVSAVGAFAGGEQFILAVSFLAGQGAIPFWIVFLGCLLGTIASDAAWFALGRSPLLDRLLRWERAAKAYRGLDATYRRLSRRGILIAMLGAKFVYGTRILMVAYLSRSPLGWRRFLAYNSLVLAAVMAVVTGVGWAAGRGASAVVSVYRNLQLGLATMLLFVLAAWLLKRALDRHIARRLG